MVEVSQTSNAFMQFIVQVRFEAVGDQSLTPDAGRKCLPSKKHCQGLQIQDSHEPHQWLQEIWLGNGNSKFASKSSKVSQSQIHSTIHLGYSLSMISSSRKAMPSTTLDIGTNSSTATIRPLFANNLQYKRGRRDECCDRRIMGGRPNGTNSIIRTTISWGKRPKNPSPAPKKPLMKALKQLTPHENIYTIPNILTFSRLIAAPVIGYLVLHDQHAWAVGLFAYAGITDLVDGYIARRWNMQTVVGTVIDPMADKTLMTILTVCLAVKGSLPGKFLITSTPFVFSVLSIRGFLSLRFALQSTRSTYLNQFFSSPVLGGRIWLAFIILGRDVGLGTAAIYYRWISLPPPKTFARYWDFSLPSAEVHPTTISKYNTALQLALIGATTAMPLVTMDVGAAMTAMQYLVATTTIWSGASYVYTKDAVKILTQESKTNDESLKK
ncbi:hypothetical protein G7Y89_g8753 [Cudoniella acicularis]|uniref:Cardiolipin synthase n=1 Tax=Cudoniella acicularis TaxID=354080 RepID=A0A8H4RGX9_9HELO|nr:hypothetical protein G7Y89_g8753 [Cudoniella acicularis]